MTGRAKQAIKKDSRRGFGIGGPVRLSATMVDLSMRHDRTDPRNDIPATLPIKAEPVSAKANVQFINGAVAAIPEEKGNKAAQVDDGFVETSRKVSRISISRIVT